VAHANRAKAYLSQGQYERAIADFDAVILARPKDADALMGRGNAYAKLGKQDRAKADFDAAKAIDPGAASQSGRALGDADMARHDYAAAVADYTAALRNAPDDALALLNRGAAQQNLGHFTEAAADYTAAIALTPDDARLYNNRGTVYGAQGKLDEAIADFRKALSLQPDFSEARRNLDGATAARQVGAPVKGH
jgi:tetratricopeptide (TPR) repeat protein